VRLSNYEFIEHTADIGIRVKADDLKGIFKNTALAMFEIIAERQKEGEGSQQNLEIEQEAENLDELFINWLNELLSLSATKELIFCDFRINKLDKNGLKATAIGEDIRNYRVNTEIKAATYHQLRLEQTEAGWQAEVIFDV